MGRIRGYYEWDDDQLTPGRKREGGLHQNLFDSEGNLRGSARFVPVEDEPEPIVVTETVFVPVETRWSSEEEDELEEAIAELLAALVLLGMASLKPRVQRYWNETAKPALDARMTRVRSRLERRRSRRSSAASDEQVAVHSEALAERRPTMSRAEAQARYLAALAAHAFSDEQLRLVTQAEIVDGTDLAGLERSISELPAHQVRELLGAMVMDPSLLSEAHLAELASLLSQRELEFRKK
ncbi:MAG: hypothetical protein V9G09_13205 [Candidatus Nanopelagicales bacterium]